MAAMPPRHQVSGSCEALHSSGSRSLFDGQMQPTCAECQLAHQRVLPFAFLSHPAAPAAAALPPSRCLPVTHCRPPSLPCAFPPTYRCLLVGHSNASRFLETGVALPLWAGFPPLPAELEAA